MRVDRINLNALDIMANNDISPIIGKVRPRVEIGDGAICRGVDRVGRFALFITLKSFDIEALMKLIAVGTNTTEHPTRPGFAGSSYKKAVASAIRIKQGHDLRWAGERVPPEG